MKKKYTCNTVRLAKTAAAIALLLIFALGQLKAHRFAASANFDTNTEHISKKFNFFHIKCNKTIIFSYIYGASSAVSKKMIATLRHINQVCSRQLPDIEGRREAAKMQKTAVVAALYAVVINPLNL